MDDHSLGAVAEYDPEQLGKRVYHLRKGGMSFASISDIISEELNIIYTVTDVIGAFRNTSMKIAQAYGTEDRQVQMTLEMERLDDLQGALWNMAVQGDMKAVETILKVMNQRQKLLGLDQLPADTKNDVNTVLIVGGSQADFLEALKHGQGKALPGPRRDDDEDERDDQEDP